MPITALQREEQKRCWALWQGHIKYLKDNDLVTSAELRFLEVWFIKPDIIGNGIEKVRPGELGKLDVFDAFEDLEKDGKISRDTRFKLAGISGRAELLNLRTLNVNGRIKNNHH